MDKNKKEAVAEVMHKNKKALQIALSVLVAVAVWFYVGEERTVSVTTSVHDLPVEFSGEDTTLADKNLMLLSGYDTTVDLTLKGPRKVLWMLDKDEIRIVADTSTIQDTGVQTLTYQVVYPDNIKRSEIQVASASIYAITVTVGELYTKEVPVYCDVTGKTADGYVAETLLLDPTVLVLRAQRDDLLNVSYAKVSLDLSGAKDTVIQTVEYQLYDYNDIPITNDNIRAGTKLIQVTVPVKTMKDVPLLINFVEAVGSTMAQVDYSIDPETVRLKGDKAALNNIDSIVLDTIYLQDLAEYQTLTYEITVPEGLEIVGEKRQVTVTIVVSGVSERRVSSSNFVCAHVPQGFVADVVTESLNVTVRGLSSEVSALTGDNLQITADLSGITGSGSFTVPAVVKVNGYSNVGIKGNYQVIVNVDVEPETESQPGTEDPTPDAPQTRTADLMPTDAEQTTNDQANGA